MKFNCPQCQIAYELPDVDLSARPNAQLRCRKCLTLFAIADALKQAGAPVPTASNGADVPAAQASATAPVAPAPPVVGAIPRPIPRPGEVHSKLPQVSVGPSAVGLNGPAVGLGGGAASVVKRTSVPPVVNLTPVAVPKPRGSAVGLGASPVVGGLSSASLATSAASALASRSASRAPVVGPLVEPGPHSVPPPAGDDRALGAPAVNGKGTHAPLVASANGALESQPPPASHVPALPPLGNLNAGKPAVRVSMPVRLTGSPLSVPPPSENAARDQTLVEPPLAASLAPAPVAVSPEAGSPVALSPVAAAPVAPVVAPVTSAPESTRSRDAAPRSARGPGVAPPLPSNAFAHQAPTAEAAQVRAATTVLGLVSPTTLAAAQHAAAPPPPEQFATSLGQPLISAEPPNAPPDSGSANSDSPSSAVPTSAVPSSAAPNSAAAYAFPLMGGAPAQASAPPSEPPQVYDSLPPDAMDSVPAAAPGAALDASGSASAASEWAEPNAAFTSAPTAVATSGAAMSGPIVVSGATTGAASAGVAVQGALVDSSGQQSLVATWGQNGLSFPPAAAVPVVPSSLPAAAPSYAPSRAALDSFPELRRKKGVPALAAVLLCLVFAGGGFAAGRIASPAAAPATAANNAAPCTDKALAARGEAPPPPPPAAPAAEQNKLAEPEQAAADVAPDGPSIEETVDESPSNAAKGESRVRKSVASNANPAPEVDEAAAATSGAGAPAAAASGSAGGGLLAGLGTPEAAGPKTQETAPPPPGVGGLSAAEIQKTVAQNQTGVRQACWQKALAGSSIVAARSARVSVTVQIAPSGGVISVTHGPDPAGYPGLANCVTARVRGWRFARAGTNTTANIPFVFAAQ